MSEILTRAVANIVPKKLAEEKIASGEKLRIYWGIDPTGDRVHLGHAVVIRKMQEFVDAGHEVIFLIGSFTAMIGDPSGQDKMREPLTKDQVHQNFQSYKEQASKILDFSAVSIRYNHEWLEKLTFEDIVKLASHFTVQQMGERDMFERRMKEGKPVSLHEFLYPLMVGYDSVILDVDCELGGSDQEFNMLAGRTLQNAFSKRDKFVLTTKLLDGTDGRKMSKTYDNCVYIEDEANDMYGKVLSINDDLIPIYMECCTNIPMEEIASIEKDLKASKGVNPKDLKMRLAREIVTQYHSADTAKAAEENFQTVHKDKGVPEDIAEAQVKKGSALLDVMVQEKLAKSKAEAKRLIEQGGVKLDDVVVKAVDAEVSEGVLKVGKRKFLRVIVK